MSLMVVISLVGVVVGIELTLRVIDHLYTRKIHSLANHNYVKRKHKKVKTYRETPYPNQP
jgi:uncharacterized protein (UPF0303 family)